MAEIAQYFYDDLRRAGSQIDVDRLKGKSILVTGACGLIGSAVAKLFLLLPEPTIRVFVSGRNINKLHECYRDFSTDSRISFIEHDITHPLHLSDTINYIIDCASPGNPKLFKEKPVDVINANIYGVNNLLTYALEHGVEKTVYISSGEVYGEGDGRIFTEEYSGYVDPTNPRSCYPSSKRAAETLCVAYCRQFGANVSIARPCHIYGPNFTATDDRAFAQFFSNAISGQDIVLKSRGGQVRSWLYVVDCAHAIAHILLNGECGQAYNIAPIGEEASILQLAQLIAKTGGCNTVFDIPDGSDKNAIITRGVLNPQKLNETGWRNSFTLSEGVKRTFLELTAKHHK